MKNIDNFEKFSNNENLGNTLLTIEDFLKSFPEYDVDYVESDIKEFVHTEDDFDQYIIVDESIVKEKEYVLMNDDENEIFVYTNNDNKINGYAFNND
ncbi:hypothetical protein M0Q50_01870 [bacterium]|jgi:hypothetical protein|nr:hypothetical protein [bacterium]